MPVEFIELALQIGAFILWSTAWLCYATLGSDPVLTTMNYDDIDPTKE